MSSPIVEDAEGPWLPLTPEARAELVVRLATTRLPAELLAKYRLRGPVLSRSVRTGIVAWVEEKSSGGGLDWSGAAMAKYRAVLRHVGPPTGEHERQAGFVGLELVGAMAVAGVAGAAAAAPGSPVLQLLHGAMAVENPIAGVLRYDKLTAEERPDLTLLAA